jgi:nucleoside-diphosphate-sugar epimerase
MLTKIEVEALCQVVDPIKFKDKKILITGGSGMVGSYLVESLIELFQNFEIEPEILNILVRKNSLRLSELAQIHSYLRVECSDFGDYEGNFYADYVFHLASPASPLNHGNPSELDYINKTFLEKIIPDKNGMILFISSGEVYGSSVPSPIKEEFFGLHQLVGDRQSYPKSKIAGEELIKSLNDLGDVTKFKVARLFHTFGPGIREDDGRSFSDFLYAAANGRNIKLHSAGKVNRSFLYSLDAVTAFLKLAIDEKENGAFNVGSDIEMSIIKFAEKIVEKSSNQIIIEFTMPSTSYVETPNLTLYPDTRKLRSLGWEPKFSIEQAISLTLDWIRKESVK